ncbi:hypothetical protein Lal_00021483 [Lupinus albus]|nr:hypothetical protein Lal_00021483 [Lupinus albus]
MKLELMYAIKNNISVILVVMIMRHMWSFRGKHSLLPYFIIITIILEHFGIFTAEESKIELDARDNKIDLDVIHKMGISQHPTDMFFKHHNDELTYPSDVPTSAQPEPQPSQFQFESSSSTNMSTNKMIMNEWI